MALGSLFLRPRLFVPLFAQMALGSFVPSLFVPLCAQMALGSFVLCSLFFVLCSLFFVLCSLSFVPLFLCSFVPLFFRPVNLPKTA
jgi:hypothetical protein